jgi:hypothetical protein
VWSVFRRAERKQWITDRAVPTQIKRPILMVLVQTMSYNRATPLKYCFQEACLCLSVIYGLWTVVGGPKLCSLVICTNQHFILLEAHPNYWCRVHIIHKTTSRTVKGAGPLRVPNRGPPRCVTRAAATFVNYTHTHTHSSAPVSAANTFQDLPRLRETADNTERYI